MSEISEERIRLEKELNKILAERAKLGENINAGISNQTNIQSSLTGVIEGNSASRKKNLASQQAALDAMIKEGDQTEDNTKKQGFLTRAVEKFNKVKTATIEIFSDVIAKGKIVYNVLSFSFLYDQLADSAAAFSSQMRDAFNATQDTIEAFGAMGGDTQRRFRNFMDQAKNSGNGLANTGRSLASIYGEGYVDTFKALTDVYKAFGNEAQMLDEKIQKVAGQMILFEKGLGITLEAQKSLLSNTEDVEEGYSELAKTIVSGSKVFGVNIKDIGKAFGDIALDVKNFGYMTKKEMADTATYVARLGLSVQELTSFAQRFDTFESAAENVAKLSAAFGIQLDTMNMVMEDNPVKKLDMVREALERSGRSIKDIAGNRREMAYLADTIGLPIDKIKELSEISVDEFGFAKVAEETEAANAKMSEQDALNNIAKNMRMTADAMKDLASGGFFQNMIKGFTDTFQKTSMFRQMMSRINKDLRTFYNIGKQAAYLVSNLFFKEVKGVNQAPLAKVFEAFLGYFDSMASAAVVVKGNLKDVFEYLGKVFTGKINYDKYSENIFSLLLNPFKQVSKDPRAARGLFNKDLRDGLFNLFTVILDVATQGLDFLGANMIVAVENLFAKAGTKAKQGFLSPGVFGRFKDAFGAFFTKLLSFLSDSLSAGSGVFYWLFGGQWESPSGELLTMDPDDALLTGFAKASTRWLAQNGVKIALFTAKKFTDFVLTSFGLIKGKGSYIGEVVSDSFDVLKFAVKNKIVEYTKETVNYFARYPIRMLQEKLENLSPMQQMALKYIFPQLGQFLDKSEERLNIFDMEAHEKAYRKQLKQRIDNIGKVTQQEMLNPGSQQKLKTLEEKVAEDMGSNFRQLAETVFPAARLLRKDPLELEYLKEVNEKIKDTRENLEAMPPAEATVKLAQGTGTNLGAVLKDRVIVEAAQSVLRLNLNVVMDAAEVATSMASSDGQPFFNLNPIGRFGDPALNVTGDE